MQFVPNFLISSNIRLPIENDCKILNVVVVLDFPPRKLICSISEQFWNISYTTKFIRKLETKLPKRRPPYRRESKKEMTDQGGDEEGMKGAGNYW